MKLSADTLIELNENGCHYITDSQIDAAWRSIAHDDLKGPWDFAALDMLQRLGIEQCEECGGGGHDELGERIYKCPDCNGKGWKIGGVSADV